MIASVDVEWTKNYRVRNGNRPFCYSIVYLALPSTCRRARLSTLPFFFESVYVESSNETHDLIRHADARLASLLADADYIIGHQLSSDLAVLASAASGGSPGIEAVREAWHLRKHYDLSNRRVIDTRYDLAASLTGGSRRLVDVCGELRLGVTQPELRGTSMTALHMHWLTSQATSSRERIMVLNLRHSLSAALAAVGATQRASWRGELNVNRLLWTTLRGQFGWLEEQPFRSLL